MRMDGQIMMGGLWSLRVLWHRFRGVCRLAHPPPPRQMEDRVGFSVPSIDTDLTGWGRQAVGIDLTGWDRQEMFLSVYPVQFWGICLIWSVIILGNISVRHVCPFHGQLDPDALAHSLLTGMSDSEGLWVMSISFK